jgi:hypothetical protein
MLNIFPASSINHQTFNIKFVIPARESAPVTFAAGWCPDYDF